MILDLFKLDGKVAVVTGANTGLGQGMAVALAQAGAKVLGVARRSCEDTKNKIEADGGAFAEVIADLSDMASIDVVMKAAIDTYGRVDILVNNAGIIKRQDAIEFTEENWDSVIQVNQIFKKPCRTYTFVGSCRYLNNYACLWQIQHIFINYICNMLVLSYIHICIPVQIKR